MDPSPLLDRISIDPAVCGGRPCVRGHRIWVSQVLGMLADGMTSDAVVADFPQLNVDDVLACMAYGAMLASGHFVEIADPDG